MTIDGNIGFLAAYFHGMSEKQANQKMKVAAVENCPDKRRCLSSRRFILERQSQSKL